jgi:hypothetical protein
VSWILEDFHSQSLELVFKYVCLWLRNRVWVHVWFKLIHQVFSQSFLTVQFFYTAVALFFLTTTTVYHPEGHSSRWVICILTSWCADHLGYFPLLLFSCSYILIFQASLILILSRFKPKVLHGPNINNPLDLVLSCPCFCKIDFPAWQLKNLKMLFISFNIILLWSWSLVLEI